MDLLQWVFLGTTYILGKEHVMDLSIRERAGRKRVQYLYLCRQVCKNLLQSAF